MLDASVTVQRGGFVLDASLTCDGVTAIMGPNGSGKSTLLRAVLGAERPTRGRIALGATLLFDETAGVDVPVEERAIAYVPQSYGLFPHMSVLDNVLFGMRGGTPPSRRARALSLLAGLELSGHADRRPAGLSGGERQRVALARALAAEPKLLLLDEPLAALDATARPRVRRFLAQWLAEADLPALVVTHDAADARAFATELVVLEEGRVAQQGALGTVAARPATELVAALAPALLARSEPAHGAATGPSEDE